MPALLSLLAASLTPVVCKELCSDDTSVMRIASSILYTLPVCCLAGCIKKRWLFYFLSTIVFLTSAIETFMVVLYDNYIIAGNIIAMFTTTAEECSGFVSSCIHVLPYAIPIAAFCLFAVYKYRSDNRTKPFLTAFACTTVLSAGFLFYQLQVRWKGNITVRFYIEQNVFGRPPYNFWFQTANAIEQQRMRSYIEDAGKISFGAKHYAYAGKEVYVMAIGESLRYDNLSLGGYRRSTTPLLESLDDITLYSNYFSTANLTMYSVPQIITRATPEDFSLNYKERSLIEPFKECGFKTFAICYNNLLVEKNMRYLTNGCDKLIEIEDGGDEKIAAVIDSLSGIYPKTFFIVQFHGNHGPYDNFPKRLNKYRPNPTSDNVAIQDPQARENAYDNTILYTDFCVYSIIKAIDKPKTQSAFLMVSDHGADYENGVSDHGGNCNPRKAEYHVPLIFWHSSVWGERHTNKLAAVKRHKDKPVNADNVFYSVCDMADITLKKDFAKPEWSIFNPYLKLHERRLLVPDGKNSIIVK